jgi:hypothetical protein
MEYNDEQRATIRRIGEISARHRAAIEDDRAAHARMSRDILNLGTELMAAIARSNEIGALQTEYDDAFREFLDSL